MGVRCSYCKTEMVATMSRVKREVPNGARDLDLYNEVARWVCPRCNSSEEKCFTRCKGCGHYAVDEMAAAQAPSFPVWITFAHRCSNCVQCLHCGSAIGRQAYQHFWDPHRFAHQNCQESQKRNWAEHARQQCIREHRCVKCGQPLGLLDRWGKRLEHTKCPDPPYMSPHD
jgi:hypothetical protein